MTRQKDSTFTREPQVLTAELNPDQSLTLAPTANAHTVLTFTYAGSNTPVAGVKITMTESDGTVTVLSTDSNGQVTLPTTTNTYTLTASLTETGSDPVNLLDAIWILQHGGELRDLTAEQLKAADVNADGTVDLLDAIQILQHLGELRTLNSQLTFLDANTGNLLSATTFGPGAAPSITVIRTGDVDQGFDPTAITDHAPILTGKTTLSIDENETSIATLIGTDADADTLTYEITGGADKDLFAINASTGALSFIAGPDYEDPGDSGGDNLYNIEITVSDGTNTTVQALVIAVADLNEKIAVSNKTINENAAGATVGDLSIIDAAFGNTNITYALSGDDAEYFVLDGTTLKLKSDLSADYETQSSYTLSVTATNSAGETVTEKVVVKVANVNDDPTLANAIADQSVNEDSALSYTVPANTFADVDAGDSLTYAATLSDGSALPSWLSFNTSTRVFSGTPLNANVGVITVKVTATDGSSATVSDTFSITVANTNDAPTAIALSATAINENAAGAVVGTLTTTDVDAGDSHTYTLSGDDASFFEVVNNQLKLKDSVTANYESKSTYAVTVTSTDSADATTFQSFTVTISDVNDDPTLANAVNDQNVDEDAAFNFTVPAITFSDEDANTKKMAAMLITIEHFPNTTNKQVLQSIIDSATATANEKIIAAVIMNLEHQPTAEDKNKLQTIIDDATSTSAETTLATIVYAWSHEALDSDKAKLQLIDDNLTYTATLSDGSALPSWLSFDAATQTFSGTPLNGDVGSITVQVTATDGSTSVSDTFTLTVANTNDAPTAIALSSLGVPEKIDGAVVGTLTTTDVDVGDTHTYTVSDDRFEVTSTGILKLKAGNTVEYSSETTITLTVTTTDADEVTFDQEFTLTVGSIQLSATQFAENVAGAVVGG